LWLNLITDGAPALALAMEKGDPDIMLRKPRPTNETIINKSMSLGILVQTITQTGATLTAFALGMLWHLEMMGVFPDTNPLAFILRYDWRGIDVQTAETIRSERVSIFRLGVFSNRYMQYAVGLSIILLLLVVGIPFLQPVFNTHFLSRREWAAVLSLALIPAISEEITKVYLRWREKNQQA
jgi:Ca2+-transporting ATPase